MLKTKKERAKAREALRCFHCGGDMDGRSQEVLWESLHYYGLRLFCDKCVDEHNARVEATGEDQVITTPFASEKMLEDAAMIQMARSLSEPYDQ